MTDRAQRTIITIGSLEIEGFQMPDGSYRMSQTQAAQAIGKSEINARRFLDSKGIKALLGKGYTPDTIEVEATQLRGQTWINALPLEVVTAFWVWQCSQGNKAAIALVMTLDCTYVPVKAEWEVIERGAPVAEMMAATHQARY